ncbi:MAG: amidohydrolase family protein [Fidelibacterota bacterium]
MQRRQFLQSLPALVALTAAPWRLGNLKGQINIADLEVCDIHLHLLALSEKNGCYVNPRFRRSLVYNLVHLFTDLPSKGTAEEQDNQYVENLVKLLHTPFKRHSAVLLAMDGVYDSSGELDLDATPLLVSNDYLFKVCSSNAQFNPGASVNPYRQDALDELDRVVELGAVLIKWIPNSQRINPEDKQIIPFYRKLVELGIPLLVHAAEEHAVPAVDQSYGDPNLLYRPLEEGVQVIVAHAAADGVSLKHPFFDRFLEMLAWYPNLYGDISALTMAHMSRYLKHLVDHPHLFERLYYGSDFPLQFFPATSPFYFLGELSTKEAWLLQKIDNTLEQNVLTLYELGIPPTCFSKGFDLLPEI